MLDTNEAREIVTIVIRESLVIPWSLSESLQRSIYKYNEKVIKDLVSLPEFSVRKFLLKRGFLVKNENH